MCFKNLVHDSVLTGYKLRLKQKSKMRPIRDVYASLCVRTRLSLWYIHLLQIAAYFSTQITNPNKVFHQWSAKASEDNPVVQVLINATEEAPSRQKRQVTHKVTS